MVEETVPNVPGIVTVSASDSMIAWVWLNAFLFIWLSGSVVIVYTI